MNKEHFEALRSAAKARFDSATTPEGVKAATEEMAHIDEAEREADEMAKQNASLLASYKEIVKHEPVTDKKPPEDSDEDEEGKGLEFGEALAKVLEARPRNQ